jgi:PhzF family phenazine biosynthesis protein
MRYQYRLQNVFAFAGQPLTGNPLCVFEDGDGLSDQEMQALALQFNLSETTFIFRDVEATARMRIFTPGSELPFAGHPTLGTAHTVRDIKGTGNQLTLATQAGVIPVSAIGNRWTLRANAPTSRAFDTERVDALLAALGLTRADLAADPLWVNTGMEQLLVPLASKDAVHKVQGSQGLAEFAAASGVKVYVFSPLDEAEMLTRFFFDRSPGLIGEDPATGSACANLGGYAVLTGRTLPLARTLRQGEYTGRSSLLQLAVSADQRILVTGEVIELGRGHVDI